MKERVFMQSLLVASGYSYHVFMKSRPRSWRVDVWAKRENPIVDHAIELSWIGSIEPEDMGDTAQLEALASDLIERKYKDL